LTAPDAPRKASRAGSAANLAEPRIQLPVLHAALLGGVAGHRGGRLLTGERHLRLRPLKDILRARAGNIGADLGTALRAREAARHQVVLHPLDRAHQRRRPLGDALLLELLEDAADGGV